MLCVHFSICIGKLEVYNEINTRKKERTNKNKVNRAARVFIKASDLANSDFIAIELCDVGWVLLRQIGERGRERKRPAKGRRLVEKERERENK